MTYIVFSSILQKNVETNKIHIRIWSENKYEVNTECGLYWNLHRNSIPEYVITPEYCTCGDCLKLYYGDEYEKSISS